MSKPIVIGIIPIQPGYEAELVERLSQEGFEFTLEQANEMLEQVRAGLFEQASFSIAWRLSPDLISELIERADRAMRLSVLVCEGKAFVPEKARDEIAELASALTRAGQALNNILIARKSS